MQEHLTDLNVTVYQGTAAALQLTHGFKFLDENFKTEINTKREDLVAQRSVQSPHS